MKMKNYISPLTEAITFAPEERIMDKISIPDSGGGPGVGAPGRGPEKKLNVMYI